MKTLLRLWGILIFLCKCKEFLREKEEYLGKEAINVTTVVFATGIAPIPFKNLFSP